jgi:hypothetical protein
MKVTIELREETVRLLKVVGGGNAETALRELAARVADGVQRPGSWERDWLHQAFGDEWTRQLEQDPDCHWHERPRSR